MHSRIGFSGLKSAQNGRRSFFYFSRINSKEGLDFLWNYKLNSRIQQGRQQHSTEQSRAEQSRAEQSRAEQSRAEQSRAEQSRADIGNEREFGFSFECTRTLNFTRFCAP